MGYRSRKKLKSARENLVKAQEAGVTHAFYRHLTLSPEEWPTTMREMYENRFLALSQLPHLDPELDCGLIGQAARLEVLLARLWTWLQKHDAIDPNTSELAPVLTRLATYEGLLRRTYDRLLLTPSSRKSMKLDIQSLAEAFAEVRDEEG
jgi:hypothetical protein